MTSISVHFVLLVSSLAWFARLGGRLSTSLVVFILAWNALGIGSFWQLYYLPVAVLVGLFLVHRRSPLPSAGRPLGVALWLGIGFALVAHGFAAAFYGWEDYLARMYRIGWFRPNRSVLAFELIVLLGLAVSPARKLKVLAQARFEKRVFGAAIALIGILAAFVLANAAIGTYRFYSRDPIAIPALSERIPRKLVAELVFHEDTRFFLHRGVDTSSLDANVYRNWSVGKMLRGGSTISMQLAKNHYLTRDKTFSRKIQQAWIALLMERRHSKMDVLKLYLATLDFGLSTPGIVAASREYFGKPVAALSEDETIALLRSIPNPKLYDPRVTMARIRLYANRRKPESEYRTSTLARIQQDLAGLGWPE